MRGLTLNGWAQPASGLHALAPTAEAFDYSALKSYGQLADALRGQACTYLLGWSLGGQLAVRLLMDQIVTAEKVILIAPPYRFVANEDFPNAMPPEIFAAFRRNYTEDTERTVARFDALIAKGDSRASAVLRHLPLYPAACDTDRWLPWLNILAGFDMKHLPIEQLPPALILYGEQDKIVKPAHAHAYAQRMKNARVLIYIDAGHAPHLHDIEKTQAAIREFLKS